MRIYVAGPMTGRPGYNANAFNRAKLYLTALGHDVITPLETNNEIWQKHYGRDFDPWRDRCDYGDVILDEMVARDLMEVCSRDAIALLDEWETSKGTINELMTARNLGKVILSARTGKPIKTILHITACNALESETRDPQQMELALA